MVLRDIKFNIAVSRFSSYTEGKNGILNVKISSFSLQAVLVSQLRMRYIETVRTRFPEAFKTRILICDNNPIFAQYLEKEIEKLLPSPHRISVCHSAEELRIAVDADLPDIALLDIHLGDTPENGIALAKELFPRSSGTSVIFITGYIEYVSDVYEADHIYFLQKPINTVYLERAL